MYVLISTSEKSENMNNNLQKKYASYCNFIIETKNFVFCTFSEHVMKSDENVLYTIITCINT